MAEVKNYNEKIQKKLATEETKPAANNKGRKLKDKTFKQKLRGAFISEEAGSIKDYLIFDVVIPAIKTTFRNLIVNTVDISLFGKVTNNKQSGNGTYISYDRAYKGGGNNDNKMYTPRPNTRENGSIDVRETDRVWFETEAEAMDVIHICREIYDANAGVLSVAEFLDAAQVKTTPIHHKWGWIDISNISAEPYPDGSGWYINLPKPRPL